MSLEQKTINQNIVVIRCKESFDPDYFKRFETHVLKSLDQGIRKFLINWEEVETVSSSGVNLLSLLVELIHNKNGRVFLCSIPKKVADIFHAEEYENAFIIYSDEASALKQLQQR